MTKRELRNKLAAIEHERWADWQQWVHDQALKVEYDGKLHHIEIKAITYKRWQRQIDTPYEELSWGEKQSDMEQVDRYWPLIEEYIKKEKEEIKDNLTEETK